MLGVRFVSNVTSPMRSKEGSLAKIGRSEPTSSAKGIRSISSNESNRASRRLVGSRSAPIGTVPVAAIDDLCPRNRCERNPERDLFLSERPDSLDFRSQAGSVDPRSTARPTSSSVSTSRLRWAKRWLDWHRRDPIGRQGGWLGSSRQSRAQAHPSQHTESRG